MANQDSTATPHDRVSALEMRVGALEDRLSQSTITPDDVKAYHKVTAHLQSLAANPPVWSCTNAAVGPPVIWNCTNVASGPPVVWNCTPHPAALVSAPGGQGVWACAPHPSAMVSGPGGPGVWACSPVAPQAPQGLADVAGNPPAGGQGSFPTLGR